MRKIMATVLAACIAVAASGCSLMQNHRETGTIPQQSAQNASSEAKEVGTLAQQSAQDAPSETEAAVGVKPGNYIQNSKFKMSFVQAKQYDEIASGEYYTNTPKDGKKYLVLFFEAENVSNKEQYINSFYFKAYEDGYDTDDAFILDDIDGYSTFSGDLAAGKKTKGYLVYEVDPNWKEFELTYQEIGDRETYDFALTPQDLS